MSRVFACLLALCLCLPASGRADEVLRFCYDPYPPFALGQEGPTTRGISVALLQAVVSRQAALIAKWMLVGFIHGVMNTDNMAISGETIDYGPCAFMESYNPETVFSSIDRGGRYAFGNQPGIALWNLARFA